MRYELEAKRRAKNFGVSFGALDDEVSRRLPKGAHAEKLQGAAVLFDEPAPWPQPVDGTALLDDLTAVIRRFVVLPAAAATAVALWIVASYFADMVAVAPLLAITSPDKRCGKSTLLAVLSKLASRSLPVSNVTGAALFRVIEKHSPTLVIDEADSFLAGSDDLRGILNSGHTRATAFVLRTVGDDFEPRKFSTWGFKAIACIGRLPATIADRSIEVRMRRRAPGEACEKLRNVRPAEFEMLRSKLARFAADNRDTIESAWPQIPDALNDRAADSWSPLLAIAELGGAAWAERARKAALTLSGESTSDDDSIPVRLLADVREIFGQHGVDKIASAELVELLAADPEKSWAGFNHGKPISQRQVAGRLRAFGIISKSVRIGSATPKGYLLADFEDAFGRYLPPQCATPPQTNNSAASSDFQSATAADVLRIEKPPQPNAGAACGGVADCRGVAGGGRVLL